MIIINITGCDKKCAHLMNNLNWRSILSICTIGLFIFFGFASIEEGDPTPLCNFHKPEIHKTHKVTIEIFNKQTGMPIVGEIINYTIYKTYKIEDTDGFCEFTTYLVGAWEVNSGPYGKAIFTRNEVYSSPDDYLTILVGLVNNNYYPESKAIIVKDSDNNISYDIFYVRREIYP
ncbi:MAG: hypothetical protein IPM34_14230 [Saprospiraceae bacterium]|nr:hypothetical protein [Saprospiraceae bacterium]